MDENLELYLKKYGKFPLSYSTLQKGMQFFFMKNIGYIAYAELPNTDNPISFVLSNPICDPKDYKLILSQFSKQKEKIAFVQINKNFAEFLSGQNFYVNEMGIETNIEIQDFTYKGRIKQDLRRDFNKLSNLDLIVEELLDPKSKKYELQQLSDEWIGSKKVDDKEIWFVARQAVFDKEKGVRKFTSRIKDRYTGFIVFDPMYDNGKIFGYQATILRSGNDSHPATIRYIIKNAIDIFREEGIKTISLGLSPFYQLTDKRYNHSLLMHHVFKVLYNKGNNIFPFKNLTFTKSRYGGGFNEEGEYRDKLVTYEKVYFAHRSKFPINEIDQAFKLCGIINNTLDPLKNLILRPA